MMALLLAKYWKEFLLLIFCLFLFYLNVVQKGQTEYYKNAYNNSVQEHKDYVTTQKELYDKALIKNKEITLKYQEAVIKAEENAKQKIKIVESDAVDVTIFSNRLFDQISYSNSKLPGNTESAILNYTNTYSELFKECTVELGTLAKTTDGLAVDVTTLLEAWPVNKEEE